MFGIGNRLIVRVVFILLASSLLAVEGVVASPPPPSDTGTPFPVNEAPDRPEDVDPTLWGLLDTGNQRKLTELTHGGQNIVNDVWPQVRDTAPSEYLEAEMKWIVGVVSSYEVENGMQGGAVVHIAATSWTHVVGNTHARPGYSSSVTGVWETNDALGVTVSVGVHGASSSMCSNCTSVYTGVSAPPNRPGQYTAFGSHNASNPQGFATSHMYIEIAP